MRISQKSVRILARKMTNFPLGDRKAVFEVNSQYVPRVPLFMDEQ